MSVCIAILAKDRKVSVCITDEKVSFSTFSAEYLATKNDPFLYNCPVLYAGNDMQYAPLVIDRARRRLTHASTPEEAAYALDEAYQEQLSELIQKRVLRRYKFDSNKFRDQGKKLCTEIVYNRLCERISKVDLSIRFLLCGFDQRQSGHIYTAGGDESVENFDHVGIWAIGRGAPAALASMAFHVTHGHFHPMYCSADEALYYGLEAKFMAESADTVGRSTFVTITESDKRVKFIDEHNIDKLRKKWQQTGAPQMSKTVIKMIGQMAYDFESRDGLIEKKSNNLEGLNDK